MIHKADINNLKHRSILNESLIIINYQILGDTK